MLIGDATEIRQFGVAYRAEIFAAGEYWFKHKDFRNALWAFQTAQGLGDKSTLTEMRVASCLVRTGDYENGRARFESLFAQYPSDLKIKSSFVDALLYVSVGRFDEALEVLNAHFNQPESAWTFGQYGRAYMGIHRYNEAIAMFRKQLLASEDIVVFRSLARAYHRTGKRQEEHDILLRGLRRHPKDRAIRRDYATWIGKNGRSAEALTMLKRLISENQFDAWTLYSYLQTLCDTGQLEEADEVWSKSRGSATPEFLRPVIEAHLLAAKGRYEQALDILQRAEQAGDHRDGQRSEIYVAWARNATAAEAPIIALKGLQSLTKAPSNVPLLVSQIKLALIAKDRSRYEEAVAKARSMNSASPDLITLEHEAANVFQA
jgi:tetratricopeptide (TPR) repeat protein